MDATLSLLTEHQAYVILAAITLAAFRLGYIRGRRFVRNDRPRWAPHLPPLPIQPPAPIALLLDVAAWAIMACVAFGALVSVSSGSVEGESLALLFWLVLFGLAGYHWAAGPHKRAVHQYRYATDPVYRAEYERRMAELRREAKKRAKEALEQSSKETSDSISLGAAGVEPYASMYTIKAYRHPWH